MQHAIAEVTPEASAPHLTGAELARLATFQGTFFQYADEIRPDDVVAADLTRTEITAGGNLFLVESSDGWRGCRRMIRVPSGVSVDQDGRGDWVTVPSLEGMGLRVFGTVVAVYRPTAAGLRERRIQEMTYHRPGRLFVVRPEHKCLAKVWNQRGGYETQFAADDEKDDVTYVIIGSETSDIACAHLAQRFVGLDAAGLRAFRDDPRPGRFEVEDWGLR